MKIELQTNKYECGLCVLVSMHNYFYKEKINKHDLHKLIPIRKKGLSIYDIEIIADKINLDVESYKADFNEFIKYNNDDYFATYIKSYGYHYSTTKEPSTYSLNLTISIILSLSLISVAKCISLR